MGTEVARYMLQQLVALSSPDLHTVTSTAGVLEYVSPASAELLGWTPEEMVGRHQDEFVHPHDVELVDLHLVGVASGARASARTVVRMRCADGAYRWTEALSRLADVDGRSVVLFAYRDVDERRRLESDLKRVGSTDPLTGLASRAVFLDRLEHSLTRLARREGLVAVLLLDVDQLKLVIDRGGHQAGNAVLRGTAERLRACVRPQDTLARLGDAGFAVIADIESSWEAVALGKRVTQAGCAPFDVDGVTFLCSTHLGIAVTTDPRRGADELVREAELALLRSKERHEVHVFPMPRSG